MPRRRGYDATRRNRNIGTGKQGRGRDNRMGIPWPKDRDFEERLVDPRWVGRIFHGDSFINFVVEPTRAGHVHPCTLDDVQRVLELLPVADLEGLEAVVMRQPTRKQALLDGVWGRWRIVYRLGAAGDKWQTPSGTVRERFPKAPAVFLEAVERDLVLPWSKKLTPLGASELERLGADGHRIVSDGRHHVVHTTVDTCRATMLYRTLPHEVGHHLDYWSRVVRPSWGKSDAAWTKLERRYWSRPHADREAFAHRYADEFRERMFRDGHFPFERIVDPATIAEDGLELRWFGATEQRPEQGSDEHDDGSAGAGTDEGSGDATPQDAEVPRVVAERRRRLGLPRRLLRYIARILSGRRG